MSTTTYFTQYAFIDDEIKENVSISVDSDGTIAQISIGNPQNKSDIVHLGDKLLVPGFVNAHSHAFHRHLRGKSEIGGRGADTFWAWRDNMYALVDGITEEKLYNYCLKTFKEMVSAGITTVGEFHYVHHGNGRFDLDSSVIQATKDAGIRIVLIQTLYERAGFDNGELHPVQKSAFVSSYDEFIANMDRLLKLSGPTTTIAVAAHSTRAVPFGNIRRLFDFARTRKIAFHIHLEEQPKEILDCQKNRGDGKTPSDSLLDDLEIDEYFTAVHATYTSQKNMKEFASKGANVCICPLTEGYLGDGIPHIPDNLSISFGTDCNNRIDFIEEMRWACYSQQMKHNSRSVSGLTAKKLLESATKGGARALALQDLVGSFEVGKKFDAVAIDTKSPLFEGLKAEHLIDAVVFSGGNREIHSVYVNGKLVYKNK